MLLLNLIYLKSIFTSEKANFSYKTFLKDQRLNEKKMFNLKFMGVVTTDPQKNAMYDNFINLYDIEEFDINCIECNLNLENNVFGCSISTCVSACYKYKIPHLICYKCLEKQNPVNWMSCFKLLHFKIIFKKWVIVFPKQLVIERAIFYFQYFTENFEEKTIRLFFDYLISTNKDIIVTYHVIPKEINNVMLSDEYVINNLNKFFSIIQSFSTKKHIDILKNKSLYVKTAQLAKISNKFIEKNIKENRNINEIRIKICRQRPKDFKYIDIINLNINTRKIIRVLKKVVAYEVFDNLKINLAIKKKLIINYTLKYKKFNIFDIYVNKLNHEMKITDRHIDYVISTLFFVILLENNNHVDKIFNSNPNNELQNYYLTHYKADFSNVECYYNDFFIYKKEKNNYFKSIINQLNSNGYEILSFALNIYKSLY